MTNTPSSTKVRAAVVGTLLLVLNAGCQRTEPSAPAARAPSQTEAQTQAAPSAAAEVDTRGALATLGAPSLLSWTEVKGRCEWSVLRPPQLEERLVMVTYRCPSNDLVWDRRGGRSLFAIDRHLYLHDWKAAKVDDLGRIPVADDMDVLLGISDQGALRVCSIEERAGKADEDNRVRVFRERQADGTWLKVAEETSGFEMEEFVPCSGLLGLEWAGSVYYNPQAQVANNCTEDSPKDEICPGKQAIATLQGQVRAENDGVEYLALTPDRFLAYATVVGDAVHPTPPIFLIEKNEVRKLYDRGGSNNDQVQPLLSGDYFLVRSEIFLNYASLFKQGEAQPVKEFPNAARVIWIPGTIEPGKVIEVTAPADAPRVEPEA